MLTPLTCRPGCEAIPPARYVSVRAGHVSRDAIGSRYLSVVRNAFGSMANDAEFVCRHALPPPTKVMDLLEAGAYL